MQLNNQFIPIVGLGVIIAAGAYMVVHLHSQEANAIRGNFTNAQQAEVRDAQGQAILQGPFVQVDEEDEDMERKAALKATGIDPDASGEAEVEFAKAAPTSQEIEFTLRGLDPGAAYTLVIDGQSLTTVKADTRGRVEIELDVKPAEAGAR